MTLPWTEIWHEAVKGWQISRLRPVLPYYRSVLRSAYKHSATWKDRVDWAEEIACDIRTVTKWNRVLRDYYLLLCGFEKQTPTGEPARNPNGVYILRPVDPAKAKKLLDEHGPVTHATEKTSRRRKRKRNLDKNVQVNESSTTTESAPLDASGIVNLDKDVYRKDLLLGPSSSPTRPNTWECRITEDAFSEQSTPPVEVPATQSLDVQKKIVASCAPSPEAQALFDTIGADIAVIRDRTDVSLDDKEKIRDAAIFIRARGNPHGLYRRQTESEAALHNFGEVTNTPRLAALFDSVLDRDRAIEPKDCRKGHDANGGALYHDAVPF
jgi:hypothetical protein